MHNLRRITTPTACLLAAATIAIAAPPANEATTLLRVEKQHVGAFHAAGLAERAVRIIDYGTFQAIELPVGELDRAVRADVPAQRETGGYALTLGEQRFDPRVAVPAAPASLASVSSTAPDLRLVQFAGPAKQAWLDALEREGLRVVQYIHPYTYVVYGEQPGLQRIRNHAATRWTGDFLPAYRLLPAHRKSVRSVDDVSILMLRESAERVTGLLSTRGATLTSERTLNDTFSVAHVRVALNQLEQLAAIPGVYAVRIRPKDGGLRGEMSNQINVNNHDPAGYAYPGYWAWLNSVGLSGAGVIMANVDGGVDHVHPDLANNMLPCFGTTCSGTASSHGTHTAAIMAGDGSSGVTDGSGFLRGLGVAPGAQLVEQVYSPHFTYAGGMLQLIQDSYANGALLSGNSWGPAGSPRGYDDDTMQVDIGVRDADPNAPGNQSFSYVLSFMNGYGGTSTQGTPDEAKNIFTIGSTKVQFSSGTANPDINDLSSNSAHGPALDGRTIPHMVAPGCYVDSAVLGSGYGTKCGTSMASPHVSGAVALFVEYFRTLPAYFDDPSPALIKAAFLAVTHNLAGHDDADGATLGHPFDNKQGWGRMNLEAVVDPQVPVIYLDNPTVFDRTGERWGQTFTVADPNQPLRIMLAWTDAPGHGLGGSTPAWNNDLNLTVLQGATRYTGNDFGPDGWSNASLVSFFDTKNNTEGVFIGPTASGNYSVRIQAWNINSDGVPNHGDATDQDFSLVVYNAYVTNPRDGDHDDDGDVDYKDFRLFEPCLSGPDNALEAACSDSDVDEDNDADLADLAVMQAEVDK